MTELERNWAGALTYSASALHPPSTIEQVHELVRGRRRVRALGTRHSFNAVADSFGELISLARLNRVVSLDRARRTVRIEGGSLLSPSRAPAPWRRRGPCHEQASVAIHFTWKPEWPAVRALLSHIEAALEPFGARPHWGKLFTMPASRVRLLYRRLPDVQRLLRQQDPDGKFRNAFIDAYVAGEPAH